MLEAVEGRTKKLLNTPTGVKLFKLIEWEILLVDVMQCLHMWPNSSSSSLVAKVNFCKTFCIESNIIVYL